MNMHGTKIRLSESCLKRAVLKSEIKERSRKNRSRPLQSKPSNVRLRLSPRGSTKTVPTEPSFKPKSRQCRKPYDEAAANRWEAYVRKHFPKLPHKASILALLGLRSLERAQAGFCEPIVANYPDIADASYLSKDTVGSALAALDGACIDFQKGQPHVGGAASQIRRLTIAEIENPRLRQNRFRQHAPPTAETLAVRLRGRSILYEGVLVKPHFDPRKTGRIYTSAPNIQGDARRLDKIASGLHIGEWVIEVDFKAAEPSVLRHVLHTRSLLMTHKWPADPYQLLASLRGVPRDEAKQDFLRSFYTPNTQAAFVAMNVAAHSFFGAFADAVGALKDELWRAGKPSPTHGVRRHVRTLAGTFIESLAGEKKMHRGKLLSWFIQGTVADILNAAVGELLDREQSDHWRVVCPVHDSVIVTSNRNCADEVGTIMQKHARHFGIDIQFSTHPKNRMDKAA